MDAIMGMPEIKEKFAGEWVLIGYEELDEDLNVLPCPHVAAATFVDGLLGMDFLFE